MIVETLRHLTVRHCAVLILTLLALLPGLACAEPLVVRIDRAFLEPMPIAVSHFSAGTPGEVTLAKDIRAVIEANLERSGLFRPIDPRAFIESALDSSTVPHFPSWRKINTQALLTGSVHSESNGEFSVEFRVWDVLSGKQFAGKSFTAPRSSWRRMAHLISDAAYERLTGEGGYFDTRIVYIAESGPWNKRVKRLAIMDQDGANHRFLTSGKHLVLTPRFDRGTQRIIYMGYYGGAPSVYLYNIETGAEELLGKFPGMSFAPRFSPDGREVIMSISLDGNTEIFRMDLATKQRTRLTNNQAIDTSPSFSPDGERIVFNSDRGGSQQLYVMDRDGDNVERISFGKGSYGTPVWSPRGDLIAFTHMRKGAFHIGVMRPDGSGERLLTEGYLVEGPEWAPNGRVLVYTKQPRTHGKESAQPQLYTIDLTGYNERELKTPINASDPAWSPLLGQ